MRLLIILLLAAVLSGFIAACGEDDSTSPGQSEPSLAAQQTAEQPERQAQQAAQPEPVQSEAETVSESEAQPEAQAAPDESTETEAQPDEQTQPRVRVGRMVDPDRWGSLMVGGQRPAMLFLPDGIELSEPLPLVILLHGYGSNSLEADLYFGFGEFVDEGEFGLLIPDGTANANGDQFWNATPECCDIFGGQPNDVGYIKSIIAEAGEHANFDQVFAVGHSNGGFMAYRLACEEVPGLTAIVSLAGGAFADESECRAPSPLSVLQIHGTKDGDVLYEGGRLPAHPDPDRAAVPGAKESILRWAERAGCNVDAAEALPRIDTDTSVEGAETLVHRFIQDCAEQVVIELWTIEGGGHIPLVWETDFSLGILGWLSSVYYGTAVPAVEEITIGVERTAQLMLPAERGGAPLPLVVSLHGYGGQADWHDEYFGLSSRLLEYGFALITPQGSVDARGNTFWNTAHSEAATKTDGPDDYLWISGLVKEARQFAEISGVFVVGYSNGGFMSYRLACGGLHGLTAIASLGGLSSSELGHCADAAPVSVLQIHGSADWIIPYAGTMSDPKPDARYPGVAELMSSWAARANCSVQDIEDAERLPAIDLDREIAGSETAVQRIREGCVDGITIEVWTVDGGGHSPDFQDDWPDRLLNWLFNESRTN